MHVGGRDLAFDGQAKRIDRDVPRLIYDFRTMAERVNARLKDKFGARFLRLRGALKVKCCLMFAIVALAVDQIFRVVDDRTALGPSWGHPPGAGKITSLRALCKKAQVISISNCRR